MSFSAAARDLHLSQPSVSRAVAGLEAELGLELLRRGGTMSETRAVRLREGRIVEQFVGDNNFSMPHQELVTWGMDRSGLVTTGSNP